MRKLLAVLGIFLGIAGELYAQTPNPGGPGNIAGTVYASNLAQWTISQGNNGPFSWSSSQVCTGQTSGGVTFKPFVVGSPIRIVDQASPTNSETVTVTMVNISGSGCQIQTSTPAHTHYSFYLTSATAGVQEAINYSLQFNGDYMVYVTPDFTKLGGVTSTITGAKGSTSVSILDVRTACPVAYNWNGSTYAGTALCGGGGSGCGPVLGDATSTNCGTGNRVGDTASIPADVQTFGESNGTNNSSTLSVAAGNDSLQNVSGQNIIGIGNGSAAPATAQAFTDVVALGDFSAAGNISGSVSDAVAIGDTSGTATWGQDFVAIGNTSGENDHQVTDLVAIGDTAGEGFGTGVFDVVALGDAASVDIGAGSDDIVGIGDASGSHLGAATSDVVAIGDGSGRGDPDVEPVYTEVVGLGNAAASLMGSVTNVVGVGESTAVCNNGNQIVAIGYFSVGGGYYNGTGNCDAGGNAGNDVIGIGDFALTANIGGTKNVAIGGYAGSDGYTAHDALGNSNVTGSDNTWIGYDSGPNTTTQLSNTLALGYQAHNNVSNQTTIGNASITSLKIFGCPSGQSVYDDGSGTCYVPGSGGSGGTNVGINGGSALTTLNLNGTTPAAGTNGINVTWQVSSANASAEIVGDGVATHFLNGTGTWTAPSGSGGITALTGDGTASGSGSVAFTLATVNSGPGTCGDSTHVCQVVTNGKGLVTGQTAVAISGGGGSSAWSALTNPSGNLALTMGADTSTFTYGATTGSSDMFALTDTASNTGTGILLHPHTQSGSTETPWQADANGVGWQVGTDGSLKGVGSSATHGATFPTASALPTPVASSAGIYSDTSGNLEGYENGGSFSRFCTVGNALCGGGTVSDGSGTSTANEIALSTSTAHVIAYSTAIPNGTTGTTQSANNNSTKLATTAYVDTKVRQWSCQPGLGDGLNVVTSGTYLQTACKNTTGATVTITGVQCYVDGGTPTMNVAGNTLGALLTGAITCSTSYAAGTQSANVLLTSGDYLKFTFVAGGTAKQTSWVVTGTY